MNQEKPTNGELFIMIKNLDTQFKEFREENKSQFNKLEDKIDDFIKCSEAKFANKWVEKAVWGGCAVLLTGILVAIVESITK
jgi:hypothetical protein